MLNLTKKITYLKSLQSQLSALFNHAIRFYELKSNPVVKAGPLGKGKAEEMIEWQIWRKKSWFGCVRKSFRRQICVIQIHTEVCNLIDWICASEQIKSNNNEIRSLTGEYKRIERACREWVRVQLERMKALCKERDSLYEKQNDLRGQKQKIEKALER